MSQVTLQPPSCIRVNATRSAVFEALTCAWGFANGPRPGTCAVDFSLRFRVASGVHGRAMEPVVGLFFAEVAARQIEAFESRCRSIYGHAGSGAG